MFTFLKLVEAPTYFCLRVSPFIIYFFVQLLPLSQQESFHMEHQSLTAQIASKGKKHMENFQPTFFSQIPYSNVTEINYLKDLEEKKQSLDFPIFEFQKDFGQQAPVNDFDMLANTLYKKIMQQGYIQQKKAPSKKKKKTKNPLEYDYEDQWINDQEAITVKKNIYVKLQNFKCYSQGIDDFYNSEIYKSSLSQIQQQSKKRTNEITMDAQELQEIKKKIKQNISITHNKMKEELEGDKSTMIAQKNFDNEKQANNQFDNQNQCSVKMQKAKSDEAQLSSDHTSQNKEEFSGSRTQSKGPIEGDLQAKPMKTKKASVKATRNSRKVSNLQKKQGKDQCVHNQEQKATNLFEIKANEVSKQLQQAKPLIEGGGGSAEKEMNDGSKQTNLVEGRDNEKQKQNSNFIKQTIKGQRAMFDESQE